MNKNTLAGCFYLAFYPALDKQVYFLQAHDKTYRINILNSLPCDKYLINMGSQNYENPGWLVDYL